MFKIRISILFSSIILSIIFGCTNLKVLRIQEIKAVETKVDSLSLEFETIKKEIVKQTELLRQMRADQKMGFSDVDRKMSALAGNVYESTERLSRIDHKTGQLSKQMEEQARIDSLSSAKKEAEVERLYSAALADFTAGRYDMALQGFQDLLQQYSKSSYAELSLYWSGECQYAEKHFKKAAESYKTYIQKYPEGEKVNVALFKLGSVYASLNKKKSAKMIWEKLIAQFPDSPPAKAAQSKLDLM